MGSWRLRDLVVEAWRNLEGSAVRTLLLLLLAGGVTGGLVFGELTFTTELLDFRERFIASGGNVMVVNNDEGLPAARCESLARREGILGSAALRPGSPVETNLAPGTLFQTATMTAGGLDLFVTGPAPQSAEVADRWVVGRAAADELGLTAGMWVTVDGENRPVGAVVDTEDRNPQLQRWLTLVVAPVGQSTQCWVEFSPGVTEGREELLDTLFADTGEQLFVRPWIRLDEFARNPVEELARRPQARAWIAAGLLLATVGWLSTWFRRSEIGLYRAVGTTPTALLVLGAVEHALPLLIGGLAGGLWGAAVWVAARAGYPHVDQFAIAARTASSAVLLAVTAGSLLWPLLGRGSIAQQLKDR